MTQTRTTNPTSPATGTPQTKSGLAQITMIKIAAPSVPDGPLDNALINVNILGDMLMLEPTSQNMTTLVSAACFGGGRLTIGYSDPGTNGYRYITQYMYERPAERPAEWPSHANAAATPPITPARTARNAAGATSAATATAHQAAGLADLPDGPSPATKTASAAQYRPGWYEIKFIATMNAPGDWGQMDANATTLTANVNFPDQTRDAQAAKGWPILYIAKDRPWAALGVAFLNMMCYTTQRFEAYLRQEADDLYEIVGLRLNVALT